MILNIFSNEKLSIFEKFGYLFIFLIIICVCLTLHEFFHGLFSYAQGDPTPQLAGRLTMNPAAHIQPLGIIMMLLVGFGWAKPVPINPIYYKNRRKGLALTAFAGPLINFITAFSALSLFSLMHWTLSRIPSFAVFYASNKYLSFVLEFPFYFAYFGIMLAIFNLIPIPPLDGSRILISALPPKYAVSYVKLEPFLSLVLLMILLFGAFNGLSNFVGNLLFSCGNFIIKILNFVFDANVALLS